MRYIRLVRQFNEALACGALPAPGYPEAGVRIIRTQLMFEELAEVAEALASGDLLATLCECLDLQYVIDGTFSVYGADLGINMEDWATQAGGPPALPRTEDAQLMFLTTLGKTIAEAAGCMIGGGDWRVVGAALLQARSAMFSLWNALGVPEDLRWAMFSALHEANMAKLGGGLSAAGRVQKPADWKPADQRAVLAQHGYMIPEGGGAALPVGDASC